MNYWKSILGLVTAASLAGFGCGGDDNPEDGPPMDPQTYVIGYLNIAQADPAGDPEIVAGFNLDGKVSTDDTDPTVCYKMDYTSPAPDNEPGVDNQLGPILASVGSSLDIEGTIAENIADGSLLILMTVEGIHNYDNDPNVVVKLELGTLEGTGKTMPDVDAMGNLSAGQSINVNMTSVGLVELPGMIVNGRLRAGPADLLLSLPIMGTMLNLNIRQAQVRFDITETSMGNGVLGGELQVEETVAAIVQVAPDSIPESLARSILEGQADLQYDMAMDKCLAVSVGLVFEGPNAVRGDVVTVP